MKNMLQRLNDLEKETLTEGGMPVAAPAAAPGSPVSVNISMNASGVDNVKDLLDLMKHAGLNAQPPAKATALPVRMDMERLRNIIDGPEKDMPCAAGADDISSEEYVDTEESEYDATTEPDEQYADHNDMLNNMSGGLNRKKKMYKASEPGDNAMAVESIKEKLYKALNEKKKAKTAKPDFADIDGDGDTTEPMKKAAADKKKGNAPKKGVNPFAKKKGADKK